MLGSLETGSFIIPDIKSLELLYHALDDCDINIEELDESARTFFETAIQYGLIIVKNGTINPVHLSKSVYLHITNMCNYNCVGCYSFDNARNRQPDLDINKLYYIMQQLQLNGFDVLAVSGGEPLMRQDLYDILYFAKNNAGLKRIILATNGSFATDETVASLTGLVDEVKVAIDGFSISNAKFIRDSGSFETSINAIKMFKKHGMKVTMLPTLHKKNYRHIREYQSLALELDVSLAFSILTCDLRSKDLGIYVLSNQDLMYIVENECGSVLSAISDTPIDYTNMSFSESCGAGINIISIASDGAVYPCHMLHFPQYKMGDILQQPLDKLLSISKPIPTVKDRKTCAECDYRYLCGGGCVARSHLHCGDVMLPDPYCNTYMHHFAFLEIKLKA